MDSLPAWQLISGFISLVIAACFIPFISRRIVKRWDKDITIDPITIILMIFFMIFITYFATFGLVYKDANNQNHYEFIPLAELIIFSLIYLYIAINFMVLVIGYNRGTLASDLPTAKISPRLMNILKGFGGETFGDLAVSIAVMAGVATFVTADTLKPTFFWLGMIGALLGFLVPASLLQRWILEANDDWDAVQSAASVFFNVCIALFTVLSMLAPVRSNLPYIKTSDSNFSPIEIFWLIILGFVTILLPLVTLIGNRIRRRLQLQHHPIPIKNNIKKLLFVILIWMMSAASIGVLIWFQTYPQDKMGDIVLLNQNVATGLATLAIAPWVLNEGISFVIGIVSWIKQPGCFGLFDFLKLEKNLAETGGALVLFFYFVDNWANDNIVSASWTGLFIFGLTLAGIGTLGGVIRGLLKLTEKTRGDQVTDNDPCNEAIELGGRRERRPTPIQPPLHPNAVARLHSISTASSGSMSFSSSSDDIPPLEEVTATNLTPSSDRQVTGDN